MFEFLVDFNFQVIVHFFKAVEFMSIKTKPFTINKHFSALGAYYIPDMVLGAWHTLFTLYDILWRQVLLELLSIPILQIKKIEREVM